MDVAIVGAGTAGLCAGAYLAKRGLKVALFDSHYIAGGCATQFSRGRVRSPYLFDIGLYCIGECHPGGQVHDILDPIGVGLEYVPLAPTASRVDWRTPLHAALNGPYVARSGGRIVARKVAAELGRPLS